jgi:demethylmenaquinone methyltransferase / 2-methoxy-6-polyprenyl-1,4-benzoquinol methylase
MKEVGHVVPPHPPLPAYFPDVTARSPFVRDLFDRTAADYDSINALFSLGSGAWFRRRSLARAGLRPGMVVADIAIGTGLVAREAVALTGTPRDVIGLDFSSAMLGEARRKLSIPLILCRAEALSLADESVDFLVMGYALRHVPDLAVAFAEFRRVLRRQGILLVLEIGRPSRPVARALARFYLHGVVSLLARWRTGNPEAGRLMQYYWETIDLCVPPSTILEAMSDAGFGEVRCESTFDLFRNYVGRRL